MGLLSNASKNNSLSHPTEMPCKYQMLGHTLQNKNRILMKQQGLFVTSTPMTKNQMSDNTARMVIRGAAPLSVKQGRKRFGPLRAVLTREKPAEAVEHVPITLEEVHLR